VGSAPGVSCGQPALARELELELELELALELEPEPKLEPKLELEGAERRAGGRRGE